MTIAPRLAVKRLSENAKLPTRGSAIAAGYDLYRFVSCLLPLPSMTAWRAVPILTCFWSSAANTVIPAQGKVIVPTDLSIAVPEGCYGRIAPRSGLASKHFLDTGAGVIDADYRGPVGVLMFNFATTDYEGKVKEYKANYIRWINMSLCH